MKRDLPVSSCWIWRSVILEADFQEVKSHFSMLEDNLPGIQKDTVVDNDLLVERPLMPQTPCLRTVKWTCLVFCLADLIEETFCATCVDDRSAKIVFLFREHYSTFAQCSLILQIIWTDCWRDWKACLYCLQNQNLKVLHMETSECISIFIEH